MTEIVKAKMGRPTEHGEDLQSMADTYIYRYQEFGDIIPSRVGLLP